MKNGVCGMHMKRTHCTALTTLSSANTPPSTSRLTVNTSGSLYTGLLLLLRLLLLLAESTTLPTRSAPASSAQTPRLAIRSNHLSFARSTAATTFRNTSPPPPFLLFVLLLDFFVSFFSVLGGGGLWRCCVPEAYLHCH